MDDLARAVLGPSTRDELVDPSALIRIPSLKTDETPVALFLEELFASAGTTSVSRRSSPEVPDDRHDARHGGEASLLLNGHTDISALTTRST